MTHVFVSLRYGMQIANQSVRNSLNNIANINDDMILSITDDYAFFSVDGFFGDLLTQQQFTELIHEIKYDYLKIDPLTDNTIKFYSTNENRRSPIHSQIVNLIRQSTNLSEKDITLQFYLIVDTRN